MCMHLCAMDQVLQTCKLCSVTNNSIWVTKDRHLHSNLLQNKFSRDSGNKHVSHMSSSLPLNTATDRCALSIYASNVYVEQ